jgi:hypothetical protein
VQGSECPLTYFDAVDAAVRRFVPEVIMAEYIWMVLWPDEPAKRLGGTENDVLAPMWETV